MTIKDLDMIETVYRSYGEKVEQGRRLTGRSLTFAEKILFAHLYEPLEAPPKHHRSS